MHHVQNFVQFFKKSFTRELFCHSAVNIPCNKKTTVTCPNW